jgi:hypothetical protein
VLAHNFDSGQAANISELQLTVIQQAKQTVPLHPGNSL